MDPNVYKKFWIRTKKDADSKFTISVGQKNSKTPFLQHTWTKQPTEVKFIAFTSYHRDSAVWGLAATKQNLPIFFKSRIRKYRYFPIDKVMGTYQMEKR